MTTPVPLIEVRGASKFFGSVVALERVSMTADCGEVVCLLGDNGAGKSTLIKLICGVHQPDEGALLVDGAEVRFGSPRDAMAVGISTVYQDLALFPLMSITRNFIAGREPGKSRSMFGTISLGSAEGLVRERLAGIGIDVRDPSELVGTLSGGERQSLAIARAEDAGARVLILDEPTSSLGVREAAIVLRHVIGARSRGLAIVFITHNVHHAHAVGDRFVFLDHGRVSGTYPREAVSIADMTRLMGGGAELERLDEELERLREFPATQA